LIVFNKKYCFIIILLALFFANNSHTYAQNTKKTLSSQSKHVGFFNKKGARNYRQLHKQETKNSKQASRKMKGQSAGFSNNTPTDKVSKSKGNSYKDIHKKEIKNSKTVAKTLSKYKRTTTDKYLEEEELATRNRRKNNRANNVDINKTRGVGYKDIHQKKVRKSKQLNNEMKNQGGGHNPGSKHTEKATK
jgi:hypothetical protein